MTPKSVQQLIDTYLVKVTGFAHLRMDNQQEAEDLAQDIMLEIIDSWNRGRQVDNFDAYVWTISRNVLNRAIRRKHRITYIELADSHYAEDNALQNCLTQEENALLRREIGLLSSVYRNAVVHYYYEGKTVREIASIHSVSEGTVKWWLFEARKQLRKGVETMRQNGEKSFNPGHLNIAISGNLGANGEPLNLVNQNLLAQNILLAAYTKPSNEVSLAQELGVSRPYIESEIQRLVYGELLKEVSAGMYQTDFVISNWILHQEAEKVMEQVYPKIRKKIDPFIERIMPTLLRPDINVAGFTPERILWIVIPMTISIFHQITYQKLTKSGAPQETAPPERPDGGRWIAIGYARDSMPHEHNPRYDSNGPISSYFERVGGMMLLMHQFSGLQSPMFKEFGKPFITSICIDVVKGQINNDCVGEIEKQNLANAISLQLIKSVDGEFKPNFLFIPKHEMDFLKEQCSELGEHLEEPLREMIQGVDDVVKKYTPEHVWWQNPIYNYSHYGKLMPMMLDDYYKEGRLSEPVEEDKHLLSFYIWG